MKNKWKIFFKTVAISLFCCAVFTGAGYFYLISHTKEPVQNEAHEVPYAYCPENTGLLFDICGKKTLFYLDFSEKSVSVIFADSTDTSRDEIYGYPIDFTVIGDYSLLQNIVDAVGGIELRHGGEELAVTGVQLLEIISASPVSQEMRREITEKILYKISKNGFSRQDFLYIIENSSTNLTVPDCYYWQDYIKDLCKTVRVLD